MVRRGQPSVGVGVEGLGEGKEGLGVIRGLV